MIWLGNRRGYLSDYLTQLWVRGTGRRIVLSENPWLNGPIGNSRLIGRDFHVEYARQHELEIVRVGARGLIRDFRDLSNESHKLAAVANSVKHFYERTSEYELDAWSEWHGIFKLFGAGLAVVFSRRLQQLNVPISPLDTSKGMTSDVVQLRDPQSGRIVQTFWVRELLATGNVIYVGSYSVCAAPGHPSPCVKVVFPLPNGNAIVIMKTEAHEDGSFSVTSSGSRFGDPGFYFTVHNRDGTASVRYVRNLRETIHVYASEDGAVRGEHDLRLWGMQFLRLHYRLRPSDPPRTDIGVKWNRESSNKHGPPPE